MSAEPITPICPTCKSDRNRCRAETGYVWPWHITRQLEWARQILADNTVEWPDVIERQRHVDLLRAYVQGRADALADKS